MLFSLHLRPYKLNSYQIISRSESKMHAYEIISIPGRNTRTIIKNIHWWGGGELQTVFIYALTTQRASSLEYFWTTQITFHKETHLQAK